MKRSKSVDTAPTKQAVADLLAQAATEKLVPLAQTAAAKAVPLAQTAAAKAVPLAGQAVTFAAPYAHQAVDAVTPYAQQAASVVTPYAQTVVDRVGPYAEIAVERIVPLATGGAVVAHEAAERLGPVVDAARDRVTDELIPKLSTALSAAAASPIAVEAAKRGRATVAAARGELSLPEAKERSGGRWWKRVAVVAAVAGVVALVARRFLGQGNDSGWQSARPSAPYTPPAATPSAAPAATSSATATDESANSNEPSGGFGAAEDDPQGGASAHVVTEQADGLAEPEQPAEGGDEPALVGDLPDATAESTDGASTDSQRDAAPTSGYGEGSYVGSEPPEGFVIKGNENSMKYHLPGGGGYDQTHAEVWFDSEDAAERAGFVRAMG